VSRLHTIHDTCRKLAAALPAHVPLIGFAGAPFTVATYMVAGEGTRDQAPARLLAHRDPAAFQELLSRIEATTLDYLAGQVEAGARALMLFDSWAGALSSPEYTRWVVAPIARLVEALRARCPGTPIIAFPRGSGEKYPAFAHEVRPDCLALDEHVDARWADAHLPQGLPVQGNLDQLALQAGGEGLDRAIDETLAAFANRPHIFNLGHGIGQFTPIDHVHQMLQRIRHG
jgi:uroporphyrinogen decarboxylase